MIKALSESGLVDYEPYNVRLSPAGEKLAVLVLHGTASSSCSWCGSWDWGGTRSMTRPSNSSTSSRTG
ncbi:MAG: hypothetical protein R2712_15420 [Vicinamibacterales bacterium]